MRQRQPRRSREFWKRLCIQYQTSGQTQREFAKAHGVRYGTFQNWLYTFRKESRQSAQAPSSFIEVTPASDDTPVQAVAPTCSAALRVALRSRLTLDFESLPSPVYLATLVHALDGGVSC